MEATFDADSREGSPPLEADSIELRSTNCSDLFQEAVSLCCGRLGCVDRVLILVQNGQSLETKQAYGSNEAFERLHDISRSIVRRVRKTRRAIVISNALADKELAINQSIRRIGQRSVLCAPIILRGNVHGILYADSMSLVGAFTDTDLRWVIRLATNLGKSLRSTGLGAGIPDKAESTSAGPRWGQKRESDKPGSASAATSDIWKWTKHVTSPNSTDRVVFLRSLACMVEAGCTLFTALGGLCTAGSRFDSYAEIMQKEIAAGKPLSKAMARFPDQFGNYYISIVAVGEESGTLDHSLNRLADVDESQMLLKKKIIGAVTYPAFIFFACAVGCMLAPPLFLNQFFQTLRESNLTLPWLTRLVMAISELLWTPWVWGAAALGLFVLTKSWNSVKRNSNFVLSLEHFLLAVPVLGELYQDAVTLRFIRALGLQLEAGIRLNQALKLSGSASGSPLLRSSAAKLVKRVLSGDSLADAMAQSSLFSFMIVEFIRVGEETGKLSEMCFYVESLLTTKTETTLEMLHAFIEPVAMAVVGILVSIVALACFLPLIRLTENFI